MGKSFGSKSLGTRALHSLLVVLLAFAVVPCLAFAEEAMSEQTTPQGPAVQVSESQAATNSTAEVGAEEIVTEKAQDDSKVAPEALASNGGSSQVAEQEANAIRQESAKRELEQQSGASKSESVKAGASGIEAETANPSVQYFVHRQTYGNEAKFSKRDGATSGTTGKGKRLEAIWIRLANMPVSGGIQYRTHVQSYGWMPWKSNGAMSGTRGKAKRLEAIQIRLTGQMAKKYDVYYRVHAQKLGWMGWAKNGASSGTEGLAYRLEAIQIKIVPKGSTAGVGKSAMTSYAARTASTFTTDDFTVTFPKFLRGKFYIDYFYRRSGDIRWHFATGVRKNAYLVYGGTIMVRNRNNPKGQYHYGYSKRGYSVDVGWGAQGQEDIFPSRWRKGSASVKLR